MVRKDCTENMNQILDVVAGHEDDSPECSHPAVESTQRPYMNMEPDLDRELDWGKKFGLELKSVYVDWGKDSL